MESEEQAIRLPVPGKREFTGSFVPKDGIATLDPAASSEAAETLVDVDPEEVWQDTSPPFRIPIGFSVLGLVFGASAIIWAFAFLLTSENPVILEITEVNNRIAEEELKHQEAMEYMSRLDELTVAYLGATTIEDKVRFVRHPERVRPLMEDHYSRHPMTSLEVGKIGTIAPVGLDTHSFLVVTVLLEGETGTLPKTLILEDTPEGDLLFDWEAEVAYQPLPLADFIATQPQESLDLRVYVKGDSFYCFEFSDDTRYRSFKLTERDSDEFLFGYATKGGAVERELDELLSRNGNEKEPALLKVRFLPETQSIRSVLIEEVVAPRWSYLRDPAAP